MQTLQPIPDFIPAIQVTLNSSVKENVTEGANKCLITKELLSRIL